MLGHLSYLTLLAAGALLIGQAELRVGPQVLMVFGVIGAWRYGWMGINFARAAYFMRIAYPRKQAQVTGNYEQAAIPARAHFLVTSYKVDQEVTQRVFQSVFRAAKACKGGAQVVASVVEPVDRLLVEQIYRAEGGAKAGVTLIVEQLAGSGKRDALASGLRAIARSSPTAQDLVVLIDGDSCVPVDLIEKSAPFFVDSMVGAITTDETAEIATGGLFADWFHLRLLQRHVLMSSMALTGRVLTLTGRASVFRATLATLPGFINQIQNDRLDHWRFGSLKFLTGDDKSTWFWLLKNGYRTGYLPDVRVTCLESQPKPGFLTSASSLMVRWFGNMLRTNGRALGLGVRQIGLFTWWSLLDQRVSIWTTLAGPITALIAAIYYSALIIPSYILWVLASRYLTCAVLASFRGEGFSIRFPALLYFRQLFGAIVKSYVLFRLDRQKWTRQNTGDGLSSRPFESFYLHALTLGWLVFCLCWIVTKPQGAAI